jgi:NADH dehydrogenase
VIRDQPGYSIEELAAVASWRLVRAAERAGVKRFVFFSALGASTRSPSRLLRAKAQAERVVRESELEHSIFAPSWVYSPDDRVSSILSRLAISPLVPFPGSGHARYQPIYAEDVADCVMAALALPALAERYELAGPETKELRQIVELILQARGRDRSLLGLPPALVRRPLKFAELLLGPAAPLTWEEAQLLTISAISQRADQDVLALGVTPRRIGSVYGLEP